MKYRYLGQSGLVVSRVCLGTMTFGMKDWGCDTETAAQITNKFVEGGGNFIDTANAYSTGVAEEMLGQALKEHDRDDIVLATKCYFRMKDTPTARGLSRKHILEACQASLKRLGTDFVDLYQVHGPDPYTPIDETMRALDDLVRKGMVRYIGCSNVHGWQIVKANAASEKLGLERFCSGQYMYSLLRRDVERDVLPACADQGMGLLCWSPLAGGLLTGKYPRSDAPAEGTRVAVRAKLDLPRYWKEKSFDVIEEVMAVAKEHDKTPSQVALAWLLHDRRVSAVIVGARTVAHVDDNIVAGDWDLPDADYDRLAGIVPFVPDYPQEWMDQTFDGAFGGVEFPPR